MRKIEISSKTIIFTIVLILLLNFLWLIRDLIFSLFIAFIIMSALRPFVAFLTKYKFPKILSVFVVFTSFLASFIFLLTVVVPPLITESFLLFANLPAILDNSIFDIKAVNIESFSQYIPDITDNAFKFANTIFSNVFFVVSTLFFSFYLLLEDDVIKTTLLKFFDSERAKQISEVFEKAHMRMNAWFWGQATLMLVVGVMTFIGLNLIGMGRYAIPLAVLAGLFEVVPNLGPIVSAIPAVLIGLSQSYFLGLAAVALYLIVQQLENNLIVPYIMKKAVGLSPIISLIALIIGGKLAGIIGVLLAIPTTLFIETIVLEILASKKNS